MDVWVKTHLCMFELQYYITMHLHQTIMQIYSKIRKQKSSLRTDTKSEQKENKCIHKADVEKQKEEAKFQH